MLGWGEASAWHRRLAGLHCIPTATQMTGKPSKGGLLCNSGQKLCYPEASAQRLSGRSGQRRGKRRGSRRKEEEEKDWSGAASDQQRSSSTIQLQYPSTASRAQFCLLCCQPEPMPGALTARMSLFTLRDPCRLLVWSG